MLVATLLRSKATVSIPICESHMLRLSVALSASLAAFTGAASAQLTPAMLQYQFNEVRGTVVANTASGTTIPATGTMNGTTWMSDPGRPLFRGNEAGFGCLGYRGVNAFWAHTGWRVNYAGSLTIMFWMQRDVASTSTNPFGYAFGDVSFRAFAAGAAGQGITFRARRSATSTAASASSRRRASGST